MLLIDRFSKAFSVYMVSAKSQALQTKLKLEGYI